MNGDAGSFRVFEERRNCSLSTGVNVDSYLFLNHIGVEKLNRIADDEFGTRALDVFEF